MENTQLGIPYLGFKEISNSDLLHTYVYPNMLKNYYWSDDFSAEYYIAQAKAGFIAVTDYFEEEELLLPEIQFSYDLLSYMLVLKLKNFYKRKILHLKLAQT